MGEVVVVATAKVKEGEEQRMRDVISQVAAASHEEDSSRPARTGGVAVREC